LIDKDMKKQDLQKATGVSWGVITKLSKGETVSMEVLIKICRCLDCSIDDMLDILPEETDFEKTQEQG
jgi:DNA-binding Xre family transcriptional regulator